jgi:polyphosphate kinase
MSQPDKPYINREISWLSFNERVLQEAADTTVPLLERLKFLGIYSSNLDEFFSVRVGTLKRVINAGIKAKADLGESPKKILRKIQDEVLRQRDRFDKIFSGLKCELEEQHIFIIHEKQLSESQQQFVNSYFYKDVWPRLVPIMLDSSAGFPYLKNRVIYLAIYLVRHREPADKKYALIEVPADILPRFIQLPVTGKKRNVIMLDDVIRFGLKDIFGIFDMDTVDAYTIKLTRDAELDIDDDVTKSFFEKISKSIKKRKMGQPVRFVYDRQMPEDLLNFILEQNHLEGFENIIPGGRYHNARDFMKFPDLRFPAFKYKKLDPVPHRHLHSQRSLFKVIRKTDILLHYPYQSFYYIIDLLREAAIDPQVTSIKISLYRLAEKSSIVNALVNASRNGKSVTVVMELQARFDEEANIHWTKKLEEADVKLIDGVPGLKVHAKLCLITRVENGKIMKYANIGTGNFNETTATLYSDHTLLTSDKKIANEVEKLFEFLENNYKSFTYRHLIVSPLYMRKRFEKLIKNEIKNAKEGTESYIYIKLNNLVDRDMTKKLYKASRAGVKIRLIVRSICSLVPAIPGLSDNIEAISIVDKYLEHSRIFIFCNGGKEKYFISSADWMIRNLDNRVEVAVPIYDEAIQAELKRFFEIQFSDTRKARIINAAQDNSYRDGDTRDGCRAQNEIHNYLESLLNGSDLV